MALTSAVFRAILFYRLHSYVGTGRENLLRLEGGGCYLAIYRETSELR
jgi:hypothetical protein